MTTNTRSMKIKRLKRGLRIFLERFLPILLSGPKHILGTILRCVCKQTISDSAAPSFIKMRWFEFLLGQRIFYQAHRTDFRSFAEPFCKGENKGRIWTY